MSFDLGEVEDLLGNLLGKKAMTGDMYIRQALADRTNGAFSEYLGENPDIKRRYEEVTERAREVVDTGTMAKMLKEMLNKAMPGTLPSDGETFGMEYWLSGKSMEWVLALQKLGSKIDGLMDPSTKDFIGEYTEGIFSSMSDAVESAKRRDGIVDYLSGKTTEHKKKAAEGISDAEYAEAVKAVFPTKEDYTSHMTSYAIGEMLGSVMDTVGPLGGMLSGEGSGESLEDFEAIIDIKAMAAEGIARKEAEKIYGA